MGESLLYRLGQSGLCNIDIELTHLFLYIPVFYVGGVGDDSKAGKLPRS